MRNNTAPYEGTKPYIFISYCHQDKARVYPYLNSLMRNGYRLWYDAGITPGDEWTENIAKHLEGSSIFVAFITEASLDSHNFRREINFAVQRNKNVISLYLDDVLLSAGMEMLLSSVQGIYRSQYDAADDFLRKLCSSEGMDPCREEASATDPITGIVYEEEETDTMPQTASGFISGDPQTYLMRVRTLERVPIQNEMLTIGRSKTQADYVIKGENSISRLHAMIRKTGDIYKIMDNHSLNRVGINGYLIPPGTEYEIQGFDVISLAKDHLVFFKDYHESTLVLMPEYELRSPQQQWSIPKQPLVRIGSLPMDENGEGNELCLTDDSILPRQAFLILTGEGLHIVDISGTRTTVVNGRPLRFCERQPLGLGDTVILGDRSFEVARGTA